MVFLIRLAVLAAALSFLEKTRTVLALQTACLAASEPGKANATPCTADYRGSVNFTCPPGIEGEWRRWLSSNDSSVLCNGDFGDSCDYSGGGRELWYSDEGLYFCESVTDKQQYFVNLSVHAPPMLKNPLPVHIRYCNREQHFCVTTDIMSYLTDPVTLSAVFHSSLPVTFELHHNGSKINCSALEYCTFHVNSTAVSITLDSNHIYHNRSDPGLYSFNISNAVGYNISRTTLDLRCENPAEPIPLTESKTVTIERNQPANVSCELAMEQGYTLIMCLVNENETVNNSNFDTYRNSCALCNWEQCSSLSDRPTWGFMETQNSSSPYCQQFTMTAYIPNATLSDNNTKLICAWGDDVNGYTCKGCTNIHLKVIDSRHLDGGGVQPYVYAVVCVGGVALICAILTVSLGLVVCVKRGRNVEARQLQGAGDPVPRRARDPVRRRPRRRPSQEDSCSDADTDDEQEPINRSRRIYGAVVPPSDDRHGYRDCDGTETEAPLDDDRVPMLSVNEPGYPV